MPPSHRRALDAITLCRTPELGGHLAECAQCGREHLLFHSCGHRCCPQCGRDASERWVGRQRDLLLPVPYFHVVFTLPSELRRLVRSHQRALLPVLFRAAFKALSKLCEDPRYLGGRIGGLAVLHTWTRTLEWHPHVHVLVPGGGIAPDGTWRDVPRRKTRFLVPVVPLAQVFRGIFLARARRVLGVQRLPDVPKRWVVFAKPVARGSDHVVSYLGRYVHRTAVTDKTIVAASDATITFRYRDSRTNESRTMSLAPHEWLRRFLQHVLPRGLHRVRAFGLLHPYHRPTLRSLQLRLTPAPAAAPKPVAAKPRRRCPYCGDTAVQLVRRLLPSQCLALASSMPNAFESASARGPPMSSGTVGAPQT